MKKAESKNTNKTDEIIAISESAYPFTFPEPRNILTAIVMDTLRDSI